MDTIHQNLNNSLKDYTLTYDGDIIIEPNKLDNFILKGININHIYVTELNENIKKFNKLNINSINKKNSYKKLDYSWNIPQYYKDLNVLSYVIEKYMNINNINIDRYNRIIYEMKKFQKYELYDFLRTLIYIRETFEQEGIVLGVGRGSAVSSYVLYLIGIHIIDSYKYNLDFNEFIKED